MTQDSHKSKTKKVRLFIKATVNQFKIELLATLWIWCTFANLFGYRIIGPDHIYTFYKDSFRMPLFTGFLTLGSFLLSFKSFAILRLLTVFESDIYLTRYVKRRKYVENFTAGYLDPIVKLSSLIFLAIYLSLITASMQLTIGLIPCWWTTLPCIWSATFTGLVLARTVRQLKTNIDLWLEVENEKLAPKVQSSLDNLPENPN